MPGSPIVDLRNTYGAVFVGLLFNTMLTGLEIVQAWIYFNNYWDKDKKAFKFFVGFLTYIEHNYWCLFNILVPGPELRQCRKLGVSCMGHKPSDHLESRPRLCRAVVLRKTSIPHQPKYYFPDHGVPFILGSAIFVIVMVAKSNSIESIADIQLAITFTRLWMGALVLVDISITVMMSWSLYRKRTGFARTDSMIKTLVVYTIKSGFVLSALGAAMTISFAVSPYALIYVSFVWVISKCYMNSLYAMLNTRNYVRDRSTPDNPAKAYNSCNLSSTRIGPHRESPGSKSRLPAVTVIVHRSTILGVARNNPDKSIAPDFEDPKPGNAEL